MRRRTGLILMSVGLLLAPAAGGQERAVPGPPGVPEKATPGNRLQGGASLGRNRPVVGAVVLVRRADEASRVQVTSSDSRGRFRVDGLPDGTYRVELRREGLHPVVKDAVELRFPSRAVIEVKMRPVEAVAEAVPPMVSGGEVERGASIALRGRLFARDDGIHLPDVELRFVRADGRADPVTVLTAEDGSFDLPLLPVGAWRLETRVVGFLPIWAEMDLTRDTELAVAMVRQPAGYVPSPLELMPPEEPVPPERFRTPARGRPGDEEASAVADESAGEDAAAGG